VNAVARVSDSIRTGAVSMIHGFIEANVSELTSVSDADTRTGMVRQSGIPVSITPSI